MYSNNQQVFYWKGEMFVALKGFFVSINGGFLCKQQPCALTNNVRK